MTWELAWSGFRHRGSIEDAAKALEAVTGQSVDTARRMVYIGVPKLGLPPLTKRLEDEGRSHLREDKQLRKEVNRLDAREARNMIEERAKIATEAALRTAAILGDHATQREEEARLVRANRRGAIVLASLNGELLSGAVELAKRVKVQLGDDTLPLGQGLKALKDIATIVQRTGEASRAAVQMERLLLGEPTGIHEHRHSDASGALPPKDMTPEEADKWLDIATRAVARRARAATVVEVEADAPDAED